MACYISSKQNRFYAALESTFGAVAAVTAANRFTAVSLKTVQEHERPRRRDKTGTRTYRGISGALRKKTSFELTTYLYGRDSGAQAPRYGALVQAALGAAPRHFNGGLALVQAAGTLVTFSLAHGLGPGDALTVGGELRFVSAVPDTASVVLNAPLTQGQGAGSVAAGAVAFAPGTSPASVSVYDYWSPGEAVQRILRGAAVDAMEIRINGDFHEFAFAGKAADLIDNKSFAGSVGGLTQFPAEPALASLVESPVPGHLGQVWLGGVPTRALTLSDAHITVKNNFDFRSNDFGSLEPRCIVPGDREVLADLELYGQDAPLFDELYQAARSRSPVPLMIQMGEQEGQMCGVYVPNFVPSVPEFLDDETRLRWRLRGSQAVGTAEDEIYVAFG